MADLDIVVVVPGLARAVVELDESDAALGQPPGNQALAGEDAGAVHLFNVRRLPADVEGVGRVPLHPVGQLEALDARLQLRVALPLGDVALVELLQKV